MRVLSISHRLQHPQIDNHTLFNAPTLYDYEAIVLDVAGISATIGDAVEARNEFLTHADLTVVNGETGEGFTGLADLLQRRREEVERALDQGATVVVYAAAPARISGVHGFQGLDRYFFLPAPDGMAWDASTIRGGEGPRAVVVDHNHPWVPVMETYEREVLYRAYFNDRAPGFARHAHVFLRSPGGAPIGVEFPVSRGRVVFMPTPKRPGADWFAGPEGTATLAAAAEHLGQQPESEAPQWLRRMTVPGLAEREETVEQARAAYEQTETALVAAREDVRPLEAIRDILWASGDTALTAAAVACLEAIGFTASETSDGDPLVSDGSTKIHLAVGSSNEAVGMSPHYRLRQRLDAIVAARAVAERGLVVVNGQRLTHPDERKRQFEDSLRVAAESTRYAVLPASELFAAAVAALEGASAETLAAVRQRIATTDGVVALDDLLSPPEAPAPPPEADVASEAAEDTTGVSGARAGEVE